MILRFCRSNKIGSKIIRWLTGSDYSHVIPIVDGVFFQAKMFDGVIVSGRQKAMEGQDECCDIDLGFTEEQDIKAIEFLQNQVGKPYDYGGAAAIPLIKTEGWQSSNKWFCSEIAYAAMVMAGYEPFNRSFSSRISVQHLLMLPFERTFNIHI